MTTGLMSLRSETAAGFRLPLALRATSPPPNVSLPSVALTVIEGGSVVVTASVDALPSGTASVAFTTSGAGDGGGACTTGADFYVAPSLFHVQRQRLLRVGHRLCLRRRRHHR